MAARSFRAPGLRRQIAARGGSKSEKAPEDDLAVLAEALADVTPLPRGNQALIRPPPPAPLPLQRRADDREALQESLADPDDQSILDAGLDLAFARPGVSRRTLADLRRGRWVAEAVLDLHGLKRDEARLAISEFLDECLTKRLRVVRVIHGRGLGSPGGISVLKLLSRRWLLGREGVLAYCQARQQDGGEGALQVLLRSGR